MKLKLLIIFLTLLKNISYSQPKDTIYGKIKSIREQLLFLDENRQNRKLHYFLKAMKKFEFIYFGQLLIASSEYIFLCLTFCLVKLPPTGNALAKWRINWTKSSI